MADWGKDLWDQYDAIAMHTQKGLEFLDRFSAFYKQRCDVEVKYAKDLKNLVKSFQPKKKEDEDGQFTYYRGFVRLTNELNDLAGQHERLAEELQQQIVVKIQGQTKELRDDRKRHLDEANRIQKNLEANLSQLEKSKKLYEKAYRESQKAHDGYLKADANEELSKKAVQDYQLVARRRAEEYEVAKQDYAAKLQEINGFQKNFYGQMIPQIFHRLQDVDHRKTMQVRESVKVAAQIERRIQPIIDKCLEEMVRSAEEVSSEIDAQVVVDRYKSGFDHPPDIAFFNLEDGNSVDCGTINNHYPPARSGSVRTISQQEKKQRKTLIGIFPASKTKEFVKEDFSDLPPQQRKRKIKERMDVLHAQVIQETNTRDALMKMKGVYEANPSMGDPNSVNGQLVENGNTMHKLNEEMHRLRLCLDDTEQNMQAQSQARLSSNASFPGSASSQIGGSVESVSAPSRSPSESNVPPPASNHRHAVSAIPSDDQDLYEPAPGDNGLFIVGTCTAIYEYDGASEGSIPIAAGDELLVLEIDQGDGWTHVRNDITAEEGFVPTAYTSLKDDESTLYRNGNGGHHQHPHKR
ncbi:Formin-binding protein 1-like [Hypsibius exemplaris]|uniref:Formin-binding protein 1-like n=1 Tax=Hypsibius exemplaris TaxID=2072580 RepID=A0A1W0WZC8_HYPEX|nr:Formin-binding protein 1-like [Hypsibius exemplaris]